MLSVWPKILAKESICTSDKGMLWKGSYWEAVSSTALTFAWKCHALFL